MAKSTQRRIDYNAKYNKENYSSIFFRARPEEVEAIKAAAEAEGKSVARYIIDRCLSKNPDKP